MIPAYCDKLPETKSSKHNRIAYTPSETVRGGVVTIGTDRLATDYALVEFAADDGRGFHFAKLTPGSDRTEERYSCFVPTIAGVYQQCGCKGFAFTGHCKHLACLAALIASHEI